MTFATKMLPGPTLNPVEDGLDHPAPGAEPTPNRDQVAGKEVYSIPPKVAERGIKGV
jgi:zinc finger homeobox protein 2